MVRAASEQQARELAWADFSAASLPVATTIDPPWTQPGLVRAELVADDLRYSVHRRPRDPRAELIAISLPARAWREAPGRRRPSDHLRHLHAKGITTGVTS